MLDRSCKFAISYLCKTVKDQFRVWREEATSTADGGEIRMRAKANATVDSFQLDIRIKGMGGDLLWPGIIVPHILQLLRSFWVAEELQKSAGFSKYIHRSQFFLPGIDAGKRGEHIKHLLDQALNGAQKMQYPLPAKHSVWIDLHNIGKVCIAWATTEKNSRVFVVKCVPSENNPFPKDFNDMSVPLDQRLYKLEMGGQEPPKQAKVLSTVRHLAGRDPMVVPAPYSEGQSRRAKDEQRRQMEIDRMESDFDERKKDMSRRDQAIEQAQNVSSAGGTTTARQHKAASVAGTVSHQTRPVSFTFPKSKGNTPLKHSVHMPGLLQPRLHYLHGTHCCLKCSKWIIAF
jgi:hypothetical protein